LHTSISHAPKYSPSKYQVVARMLPSSVNGGQRMDCVLHAKRLAAGSSLAWTSLAWTSLAWTLLAWTLLAWTLLAWSCRVGAETTSSKLDDELSKNGATRVIAEATFTDEAYDAVLLQGAHVIPVLQQEGPASKRLLKLSSQDEKQFTEAVLATMREALPREAVMRAWQRHLAQSLSYEELRAAVTFIRSEGGAKFWRVVNDQKGLIKALDDEPLPVADLDKLFLRELKLRFPAERIDFDKSEGQ